MSIEPDPLTTALRSTAASVAAAANATMSEAAAGGAGTVAVASADGKNDGAAAASSAPVATPAETRPDAGPCADERRVAEERCAVAARAREGAAAAAETLRAAQRAHDDHIARAEADAAAADPRAVRAAKEEAQGRFHAARARAGTHDDIEGAARAWLAEINQINHDTREAAGRVDKSRAQAASVALTLERLAVEADAARISAEQADEACVAAREAVAACDEAQSLRAAAARVDAPPPPAPVDRVAPVTRPALIEGELAPGEAMGSRAGQDALILRILRGDHAAMQLAVARLAGDEADDGRRWQARLTALAEALVARSIEASAFDFPADHFFWGLANRLENRDIMAGLSSLGYRFDGFGGWVDERIPSQRDLSLAVGYAGLDPMRVRHWPNEDEMRELLADVRVTADEYVASTAGSLTLGELVSLLGRRADALTELWNDWGHVRPVLLEVA
jgi:hypothetical protein